MKILMQTGILDLICCISELIEKSLPFVLPAPVIGMLLLFAGLLTGVIKIEQIRETADFFLKNMAFFFLPAAVGLLEDLDVLKEKLFPILLICTVSTIVTFAVTAVTVRFVVRWQERSNRDE